MMRLRILRFFIITIVCMPLLAFGRVVKLQNLQSYAVNHNIRLVFSLTGPFKYHYFTLNKPSRLVIDFSNTDIGFQPKNITLNRLFFSSLKTGQHKYHQSRVVLGLKKRLYPSAFIQKPHGKIGYRLILDLTSYPLKKTFKQKSQRKKTDEVLPEKLFKPVISLQQAQQKKPLRKAIIIIDPGHGGKDPGATGLHGTHEKDIVLSIGLDLYRLLKKQPYVEPILTRRGDYFVTLRNRLRLARKGHADLFIAIHADAYKDHYARGASVFALSQRGASSEAAHWLAQKENYSELGGVSNFDDKSYVVRSVLIDLSQTATIQESLRCGDSVIQSLRHVARLHRGFVEQAPFVVLKSPDIPSLLVETGFISNRQEEMQLRSRVYRMKIAHALMQGIVNYLHRYPPAGTLFVIHHK